MKRVVLSILSIVYVIVSVFVTSCLLTFNDYRVSEFQNFSLIIVNEDNQISGYDKGDLLVISNEVDDINSNQEILYYDTYESKVNIKVGKVVSREKVTDTESTFLLDNDKYLSSEFVIGSVSSIKVYPVVGSLLSLLESRWGYLIIIILPILVVFIYEIYALIQELRPKAKKSHKKTGKNNELKKDSKKK